jgi:hypothetical protein
MVPNKGDSSALVLTSLLASWLPSQNSQLTHYSNCQLTYCITIHYLLDLLAVTGHQLILTATADGNFLCSLGMDSTKNTASNRSSISAYLLLFIKSLPSNSCVHQSSCHSIKIILVTLDSLLSWKLESYASEFLAVTVGWLVNLDSFLQPK